MNESVVIDTPSCPLCKITLRYGVRSEVGTGRAIHVLSCKIHGVFEGSTKLDAIKDMLRKTSK